MPDSARFPPGFFDRPDESDDAHFYREPRFVTHIDDATIAALTDAYRELLAAGGAVLDLMSSWVSHLPEDIGFGRVAGLGMNEAELARNPRLTEYAVHDLNRDPRLPYDDASFDAVVNAVSVQYLTRPIEVFREVARVLRPGGVHAVAISQRCFPTKAIRAFHVVPPRERAEVLTAYFAQAGAYEAPAVWERSPPGADPLWIAHARRLREASAGD